MRNLDIRRPVAVAQSLIPLTVTPPSRTDIEDVNVGCAVICVQVISGRMNVVIQPIAQS